MQTKIKSTKISEVKRNWHLFDAKEKILGRLATEIAQILIGKRKPCFVPYLDCGDYVVVINAEKVAVTGRKEEQKNYYRYSGYPGGLKITSLKQLRKDHPERIIQFAVKSMLPKNKLRDQRMTRLKIFAGENHPYQEKLKQINKDK